MKRMALLAALLLAVIPTASATVTVTAETGDLELMAGSTGKVPVTVTVSCDEFVMAASQTLAFVITSNAPADLLATTPTITLTAGAGCAPANAISGTADIVLSPGDDAMALMPQALKITATKGSDTYTFDRSGDIWVAYKPGHTLTPDITFPYTWTGGEKLSFNVTVDITANDDTMVMFFPVSSPANGTVSGLGNEKIFLRQNESRQRVMPVTWTPPTGAWENATITFENYSHCLNGGALDACDPQLQETVVWTIHNDAPGPAGGGGKESPGIGAGLLIAVIALGLVVLRRR